MGSRKRGVARYIEEMVGHVKFSNFVSFETFSTAGTVQHSLLCAELKSYHGPRWWFSTIGWEGQKKSSQMPVGLLLRGASRTITILHQVNRRMLKNKKLAKKSKMGAPICQNISLPFLLFLKSWQKNCLTYSLFFTRPSNFCLIKIKVIKIIKVQGRNIFKAWKRPGEMQNGPINTYLCCSRLPSSKSQSVKGVSRAGANI